jgi:hypothetical protein
MVELGKIRNRGLFNIFGEALYCLSPARILETKSKIRVEHSSDFCVTREQTLCIECVQLSKRFAIFSVILGHWLSAKNEGQYPKSME